MKRLQTDSTAVSPPNHPSAAEKARRAATQRSATHDLWRRRIAVAIEYIDLHLDEELALADIASVAHFSPFHFHRLFKAFRGEPLGSYITRLRVETAAQLLRHTDLAIETIAYNVGFGVPASLNRAFRALYDTTPTEYRSTKTIHIMKTPQINPAVTLEAPMFVELEPREVLYLSLKGEYSSLDFAGAFARLWAEVKAQNLFTAGIEHICVYHDDPKSTDPARLRTDVCLTVHKPAAASGEVRVKTLPGGRYAVFTHTGPYDEHGAVYDAIYGEWVPANCPCREECVCEDGECACGCKPGEPCTCPPEECRCVLRDEPVFEKYCNDPATTASEKLRTEIYIPVK